MHNFIPSYRKISQPYLDYLTANTVKGTKQASTEESSGRFYAF